MTTAPLPTSDPAVQRLHRPVIALWRMSSAVNTLLLVTSLLIASFMVPLQPLAWAAVLVGSAGALWILFYAPARWRSWTFQVGPADVRLCQGVFWRRESVVPHVRIQHVDTRHGPIERWLGLASVIIFTAGSVGGALTIPGLAIADAEALRDHLAALSGSDDAV